MEELETTQKRWRKWKTEENKGEENGKRGRIVAVVDVRFPRSVIGPAEI